MRDLLRPATLRAGVVYGVLITCLVAPQIMAYVDAAAEHGILIFSGGMIAASLLCQTLAGLVLFGWGGRAPLPGLFRDRSETLRGAGVSLLVALVIGGVMLLLDPSLKQAALDGKFDYTVAIKFPDTVWGGVRLILWQLGMSSLLLTAAALVYFVRLSGRVGLSLAVVVVAQGLISAQQLEGFSVSAAFWGVLLIGMISRLLSCLLFLRFGLVGPVVFGVVVASRVFLAL